MQRNTKLKVATEDFETLQVGDALLVYADCLSWLKTAPEGSIDAIVTDPPYGVKEYETHEIEKMSNGGAGIWRLPPKLNGVTRAPLPRFTALDEKDRLKAAEFFFEWAQLSLRVLKPGGHMFVASNSFMSQLMFSNIMGAGFEFRTEIIRLVQTLRGGDKPKLGEAEFPLVCSLPRGSYEPWGLFRKPMPKGMTVRECLKVYGTGGLRCKPDGKPFLDVIPSERTPAREREIASHPSLKPQSFLTQVIYASLPLGKGVVLDPFMGSGSTLAAAESIGYASIGIERHREYYDLATNAVPALIEYNKRAGLSSKTSKQVEGVLNQPHLLF